MTSFIGTIRLSGSPTRWDRSLRLPRRGRPESGPGSRFSDEPLRPGYTEGRVLQVWVHDADLQDPDGGCDVLRCAKAEHPTLELVFADGRYGSTFVEWAAETLGVVVEVVRRAEGQVGFVVQARRWVVERTFSWLLKCRRLVRDSEELAEATEAWIYLAMTRLYLRRLARAAI